MKNHINYQKSHIVVANTKRGWNRPQKHPETVQAVNVGMLKLRFGSLQITITKRMNIAAVKAA